MSPSRQQPDRKAKGHAAAAAAAAPRSSTSSSQQQQAKGSGALTLLIAGAETWTAAAIVKHVAILGGATKFAKIVLVVDQLNDVHCNVNENTLKNVEIVKIDTSPIDASALAPVMRGVDVLVLIPPSSETNFTASRAILQAADQAGVAAVTLLSWTGTNALDTAGNFPMLHQFKNLELEFKSQYSNIAAKTVVRANIYVQSLITYAKQIVQDSQLPLPLGPTNKFAPLDVDMVGCVVAKIITTSPLSAMVAKYGNQSFTLTGPKALTVQEISDALSEAMGGGVAVVPNVVPMGEARKMLGAALPPLAKAEIGTIMEMYALIKANRLDQVSEDLQNEFGEQPLSLAQSLTQVVPLLRKAALAEGSAGSGSSQQ